MFILVDKLEPLQRRAHGIPLHGDISWRDASEHVTWRYSSGWFPVAQRPFVIESIGSGCDAQGRPVTFWNDKVIPKEDPHSLRTGFWFDIDEATAGQSPPFLLLPDTNFVPGVCQARVRLRFNRLSDVPDVLAGSECLREFDTNWAEEFPEFPNINPPRPYSEQTLAEAAATAPHDGLWLPFEAGSIKGAMQLGEDRGDGVFDATLYVDRDAGTIKPGSLLRRSVTWTTRLGKTGSAEADIASVVEMFSAETL